ncbi:hypothetical protein L5515_006055 [Caenorhabditis briggsae]|uniref:Uncharacterized protein n=1 Tax=Caenorhabditis briggsae TaxID=6238 RepID=A0AAE9F0N9_CAEBR|nr:hypothetical protein L5515_006055 [Caenorhabditis briggsae]
MMVWRVLKAALFISFMAPHSPVPAIEPNCEPGTMPRHTHKPILIICGIFGLLLLGIYFYVHFHSIQEDQNEFAAQEQILNQALPDDKQSSTCRLMLMLFIVRMKHIEADSRTEFLSAQEHCSGLKKCFTSSGAFRGNGNFDLPDFGVKHMELEMCCEVLDAAADWFKNSEEQVKYPGIEKCNTGKFGVKGQLIDLPEVAKDELEWCAEPESEYVQDYFPPSGEDEKQM